MMLEFSYHTNNFNSDMQLQERKSLFNSAKKREPSMEGNIGNRKKVTRIENILIKELYILNNGEHHPVRGAAHDIERLILRKQGIYTTSNPITWKYFNIILFIGKYHSDIHVKNAIELFEMARPHFNHGRTVIIHRRNCTPTTNSPVQTIQ